MARQIVVERDGKTSTFGFAKVERAKLYGSRRRVPLDPDGNPCTRASLTEDGSTLLKAGMTAQGYFTDAGDWVQTKDLVGLDEAGQPLPLVPSTLGVAQALEEVEPEALLDVVVQATYALDAVDMDDALAALLREGTIFRFPFNYRPDFQADEAFLVAGPEGDLFALVGRPSAPEWRANDDPLPATFDDVEDDDGDLDFEMF